MVSGARGRCGAKGEGKASDEAENGRRRRMRMTEGQGRAGDGEDGGETCVEGLL